MKKIKFIFVLLMMISCIVGCSYHQDGDTKTNTDLYDYAHLHEVTTGDALKLWDIDHMPSETVYDENIDNYFDEPDFVPYLTVYHVPEGIEVKGAMLVSPGGAFMFRSEWTEGRAVAERFAQLGYVSFVVHYRVQPYTERESGIDVARAVRFVRYHAKDYGIDEKKIAVVGFSAGGIANGRAVLQDSNGKAMDVAYVPDEIDRFSSSPDAVIMGYSFYGRLSFADLNESTFEHFNLPPTYYVYGTEDPFYHQFESQVELLRKLNKNIEAQVLNHYPHGFGIRGNWVEKVDQWLDKVYEKKA